MNKTPIPWVKNPDSTQGYTWNPITGCLNNCSYCYARKLANTRLRGAYCANSNLPTHDEPNHEAHHSDPFYPRFWEDKIQELVRIRRGGKIKPKGIFACDMSDLFGIGVPESWTRNVLASIHHADMHRFYLLTKQPQNLQKFSPFPENVWLGVSATNQQQFDEAVKYLKEVKATVKYISFEPLLERINIDL